MNSSKERRVREFVRQYRDIASVIGRRQWRRVYTEGKTNSRANDDKDLNSIIGAAPVQMVRFQVAETIDSWIANRANEFARAVEASSLDPETKHHLHILNRWDAIHATADVYKTVTEDGQKFQELVLRVDPELRRLAQNIHRAIRRRHRRPRLNRISPRLDRRVARVEESRAASFAGLWLRLKLPHRPLMYIPVHDHPGRQRRNAPLANAVQLVMDRDGDISVRLFSDVTENFRESREGYQPRTAALALDFGLKTMFASSAGDLLGRGYLEKLRYYDERLTPIARHMQSTGLSPRKSRRYRKLVQRVRGFIKTEVNRVINRLIEVHGPAALTLEKLDFRQPGLSRRLNRILAKCGRRVVRAKLVDLKQRLGVDSDECNPAYSSQECSSCGFVSRSNRTSQAEFICRWCGHSANADVNGARNLLARRSWPPEVRRSCRKEAVLGFLACHFAERYPRAYGRRADALRRSAFMRNNLFSVDETGRLHVCQ